MERPRWHDAVIVIAIVGAALAGAWALWWDDLSAAVAHPKPAIPGSHGAPSTAPTPPAL